MLNKKENKPKEASLKNLIMVTHKDTYYTAAALLLRALKEADITFTTADTFHKDLLEIKNSSYEKIYVIGIRLKEDYTNELKAAITELIESKKKIKIYTIEDRFEIKGFAAKFFHPLVSLSTEGKEGSRLIDYINSLEKPPIEDFKRLKDLYERVEIEEINKGNKKSDETSEVAEYVWYSINMYWKWQVGDEDKLRELITKLANNTITSEEIETAKNYDRNNYILTGTSPAITVLKQSIERVGQYKDAPVLIYGETGTGKEIAARMIHAASARREKPFMPINCAGIPSALMESMLFGHTRGAFTSADKDKKGVVEEADGGTVFLDEITDMPMDVQAKFLRFLEDFQFVPLGSTISKKANVRIVAATNTGIKDRIKEGKFRADLYYRISGVELYIPSLRERKEDIEEIARVILYRFFREQGYERVILSKKEYDILKTYDWPGNIRQLQKFLMRAIIFKARGEAFEKILNEMASGSEEITPSGGMINDNTVTTIADAEKWAIKKALRLCEGNKTKTAQALGVVLNTLKTKIREYGIKDEIGEDVK